MKYREGNHESILGRRFENQVLLFDVSTTFFSLFVVFVTARYLDTAEHAENVNETACLRNLLCASKVRCQGSANVEDVSLQSTNSNRHKT